jgi:hypothetical protein
MDVVCLCQRGRCLAMAPLSEGSVLGYGAFVGMAPLSEGSVLGYGAFVTVLGLAMFIK